jgi:cystathionine gamma-synthase
LVWIETRANPTWDIVDIAVAAQLAHEARARLVVDSTCATPILTRPLSLGADLVMHSATKMLNGHADVLCGAMITARDDEHWKKIVKHRHDTGSMPGPFESWLLLRGLRTLHLRARCASDNALYIAQGLTGHPRLADVIYPGLPHHPGHAVAARQMHGGFGSMLSLRVQGGAAAAIAFVKRLTLFRPATSLGGTESLAEHRKTVEGADSPTPDDLVRLSVGIEDKDELRDDLRAALDG